ncbi:rhomboid-like protein [Nocardia jejuensis]|uniref:rhomboid-like protein n=1 Tax=Nocardia jejuensis TaxID=328049 RepID=UPI00082DAA15|nr:rhomboid-like protein [Nocardia jejuensis]
MSLATYEPPWLRSIDLGDEIRGLASWWQQPHRARRAIAAYRDLLAVTPASIAYAFTLFVTWWTLRGASDMVGRRLILSASTNLRNMQRDPIQVLLASAFWTDGGFPWPDILILLTLMALAERWLGSLRWIVVVAFGHIGATLITVVGIAHKVDQELIPLRVTIAADVGPSYGISAMLAVLTYRLRGVPRLLWALGLLLWYGWSVWQNRTFTDYGHFFALLIGFAIGGLALVLSRRFVERRARKALADPEKAYSAVESEPGDTPAPFSGATGTPVSEGIDASAQDRKV